MSLHHIAPHPGTYIYTIYIYCTHEYVCLGRGSQCVFPSERLELGGTVEAVNYCKLKGYEYDISIQVPNNLLHLNTIYTQSVSQSLVSIIYPIYTKTASDFTNKVVKYSSLSNYSSCKYYLYLYYLYKFFLSVEKSCEELEDYVKN